MSAQPDPPPGGTFAIVAGGGTGGHVLPGLAIARALVDRGHDPASILYAGSERGIETDLVPAAGFPLAVFPGRGIQRRLTAENLASAAGIVRGLAGGYRLVGRHAPRVVVCLGGYAALPAALGALARRVPVVVAEQNAVPSATNRLVGRRAAASAVSFAGTDLPRAVLTGNPVRPEVVAAAAMSRAEARAALGLPADRTVVLVTSGSLGSRTVNEAALGAVQGPWRDRADLAVHHVVGRRDHASVLERAPAGTAVDYRVVEFEDRLPEAMAACDLMIGRAGASTVAELAVVGRPGILCPLPIAPGDAQTHNARAVAAAGAGVVVADPELDTGRLVAEADPILADPARRAKMDEAARSLGHPDAAAAVAALAEEHAR